MTDIFAFEHEDGKLVVDSRLIAGRLGLDHNDWFNNVVMEYQTQLEQAFGIVRFENVKSGKRGRPQKIALFTEDQSTFLMTLSRNTLEVVQCKIDLVKAFSRAKEVLHQRRVADATRKIYLLDDPVRWSERGRVFQESFYSEIYRLNNWNYQPGKTNHPVRVAQITIDAIYERLQPGVWKELTKKNPKINGRRKCCCHQFLTENIGNPHLRHHLYSVTKLMAACSCWREFMCLLNRVHPKTNTVQMDILFELFSNSLNDYEIWKRLVS